MNVLICNAKIIDPRSKWNGKRADILIKNGKIKKIAKGIKDSAKKVEAKDLHASPGWIDMKVHFCDPGHEYKEDLSTGLKAARQGGFTSVVSMPSTTPSVDNKGSIEYILTKSRGSGVRVYPAATISKSLEGKEMSEMIDLASAGARLFTDDKKSLSDSGLMNRALMYARNTGSVVCSFPQSTELSTHGKMNEGAVSTRMGVTGIPHIAETIQLKRDIDLLRYTDSRLHVVGLSTAEGVKLIKEAKKEGLDITAEVHLANLIWTDAKLSAYDTNYKLDPPLRTNKDRKALIKGVKDGTIDCISSDHRPEDIENKKLEFGLAAPGLAMIEHVFPLYQSYLREELEIERFVEALTYGPCSVLGLTPASIEEGRPAILTLFSPKLESKRSPIHTKAYNTPCIHDEVSGAVLDTIRP